MTISRQTLADLIVETLAQSPRDGFEICRILEVDHEVELRGREGALYAALLQLEREGWVESAWEERVDGSRRRVYGLPVLREVEEPVL